jgi:hypothetical protein
MSMRNENEGSLWGVRMEHPTIEEAKHFTRSLGWEGRFEFFEVSFGLGNITQRCYSFEYLVGLLSMQKTGTGDSHHDFFIVDLEKMMTWISDVVGDPVLSENLASTIAPDDPYQTKLDTMRAIVIRRFNQYCEVLAEHDVLGERTMISTELASKVR